MKSSSIAAVAALVLTVGTLQAMDVKVVSGDLSTLKGQTLIKVEYSYNNLQVGKGTEEEFTKKKVTDYNAKVPGKGDRWLESWKNDRERVYQPKFEELFNRMLHDRKSDLKLSPDAKDAKYTLILKTTTMEPGYNVWISRGNAYIDANVEIVETANRNNVVATVAIHKSPGRTWQGDDYQESMRLGEAYAKAGKELGILVFKKAGK
jgi:hypothetical protein